MCESYKFFRKLCKRFILLFAEICNLKRSKYYYQIIRIDINLRLHHENKPD